MLSLKEIPRWIFYYYLHMLLNCDIQQICFYRFSIKVCYSSIIIRFSTKFDSVFCFVLGVKMFLRNTLQVRFLLLFYYEYPDLFSFFFFLLRKRKWVMESFVRRKFSLTLFCPLKERRIRFAFALFFIGILLIRITSLEIYKNLRIS